MITKKLFIIGFAAGAATCALVTWLFVFRYPPLLSEDAKLSYTLAYQMGEGLKSRAPDANISPTVMAAAIRDAIHENSRLNPEEMRSLRRQSMERRHAQRVGGGPGLVDRNLKDENGFFSPRPGVKFKFLDESKASLGNLSEIQPPAERVTEFRYQLTILDPAKKEISKKTFTLTHRDPPRSFSLILNYLAESEKAEVYVLGRDLADIKKLNPAVASVLTENHALILQRLKTK